MGMIDYAALERAPLERDPFDYLVVPDFVPEEARPPLERDFPRPPRAGNFRPEEAQGGPAFEALRKELESPEFARRLGERFGLDLTGLRTTTTLRRYAQASDGNIHTDSWTKVVTVLVYFNPAWPHAGGRLRLLRSPDDIEDHAAEVLPLSGTLVAFRRSERSFHGHRPFEGERLMLQLSFVQPRRGAELALGLKRLTTRALKRLHLDPPTNVGG